MPPNLGGFFMVRSYYPSECHADYFDFERIEALKPAIEACGISTLSQRSEERFSRNAETDLVCRLLLEKKKKILDLIPLFPILLHRYSLQSHLLLERPAIIFYRYSY